MENRRRALNDLLAQRAAMLDQATAAYDSGDHTAYNSAMEKVTNMNDEIQRLSNLIREHDQAPAAPMTPAEQRDAAEERVDALRRGQTVTYSAAEVRRGLMGTPNAAATGVGVGTEGILLPTEGGTNLRGGSGALSSIIDQVTVIDAEGVGGGFYEPFVRTEFEANGHKVTAAYSATNDPAFGMVKLNPYAVDTTNYIHQNLRALTPVAYDRKVFELAMRALRRKINSLIFNGDGLSTPEFFGIKTAVDTKGNAMYKTVELGAIDENTLDELAFSYGGDEELGGDAHLYLTKADLKALGKLRGTNEKKRLYTIAQAAGNANCGTISDGGVIIPYCLGAALAALSGAAAGAKTMLYGDPKNFELAMFSGLTVRIDTSYKAADRLDTIMGDAIVGGNIIVPDGFSIATAKAAE